MRVPQTLTNTDDTVAVLAKIDVTHDLMMFVDAANK